MIKLSILLATLASLSIGQSTSIELQLPMQDGQFLGTLQGILCFNCVDNVVHLELFDSTTGKPDIISVRQEVWRDMAKPIKGRDIFDHDNLCFYFDYPQEDSIYIGNQETVVTTKTITCYPYLQRSQSGILRPKPADSIP